MIKSARECRAQKKAAADAIIRLLYALTFAQQGRAANSNDGCHPSSRGGAGLDVSDAHGLFGRILTEYGWSWFGVAGRASAFGGDTETRRAALPRAGLTVLLP